jgi:hypothetical protein
MGLIDGRIREDVAECVLLLVDALREVCSSADVPYNDLLRTCHPYWATTDEVKSGDAIDKGTLDTTAGYLLYFLHGESFGGRGGMAPLITNDVVWLTLPKGLLASSQLTTITVDGARLADLATKVTVESVLASLTSLYKSELETGKRPSAAVEVRGGDKNPRCWNIMSDDFYFGIGLLLFMLSTNPFCCAEAGDDNVSLIEGCSTILDSGQRSHAQAVRSLCTSATHVRPGAGIQFFCVCACLFHFTFIEVLILQPPCSRD